jgi:hypothetical protein
MFTDIHNSILRNNLHPVHTVFTHCVSKINFNIITITSMHIFFRWLKPLEIISFHPKKRKRNSSVNLTFRGPCIVSIFLLIYFRRDATLHSLFISRKLLYMFRVVSPPTIRSTHKCIYSIWYLLTVIATCLYCGRVGAGLSVVWELYRSVLVRPLT